MIYPRDLVDKYGAKAGILMYVAKNLPNIPQADMIVKTPEESIEGALDRADKFPILWPRVFRSSAVAELEGYEGCFPTIEVDGPDSWFWKRNYREFSKEEMRRRLMVESINNIEMIQRSSRELKEGEPGKHNHLPDEISVIIAEKSPSSIVGTYIKHPNQGDFYIISTSIEESVRSCDPSHSAFTYRSREGIRSFIGFSKRDVERESSERVNNLLTRELEMAISWHDQIVNLPEIDKDWNYQIEFGIDPVCLYQVRPFKKKQKANFKINKDSKKISPLERPLVIGVTSERGIDVRLEKDVWERFYRDKQINPENCPSLFYDSLRNANKQEYVPNVRANILTYSSGILSHQDISAIRKAEVSCLYVCNPSIDFEQGKWYNIKSDGENVLISQK